MNDPGLWTRLRDARIGRVLLVYAGASWAVLEVTAFFIEQFGLPEWFLPTALVLLLIGLAVFIGTALVQAAGPAASDHESTLGRLSDAHAAAAMDERSASLRELLTWRNAILGGVFAFALWGVVAAGWLLLWSGPAGGGDMGASTAPGDEVRKLVVLPFDNLGGEGDDYFAAGITDAITARLGMLGGLGVISRQSAIQYAGSQKTAREIGAELEVDYILEGTVQRERPGDPASRVRVIPQLIRIADDTHIWVATYDEEIEEVFRVQSEIAERVALALDITLREAERRAIAARPSEDLEAYDLYLRGKQYLDRAGLEFLDRAPLIAVDLFSQALERDPEFALAWAALASAHLLAFFDGYDIGPDRLDQARTAAERALSLKPDLAEGHTALAIYHVVRGDQEVALREARRAQAIKPSDAFASMIIGGIELRRGELDLALDMGRKAVELDPRSARTLMFYALLLESAERYSEAVAQIDRTIALVPDLFAPYGQKIEHYLLLRGDTAEARRVIAYGSERMGRMTFVTNLLSHDPTPFRMLPAALGEPLSQLSVAALGADTVSHYNYHLARGWQDRLAGRGQLSRAHFDSARAIIEDRVQQAADPLAETRALAEAYAGAGRGADAVALARRALDRIAPSEDWVSRSENLLMAARVHATLGEAEEAIALLDELADLAPGYLGSLTIDPIWDPIRDDPRFRALAARRE